MVWFMTARISGAILIFFTALKLSRAILISRTTSSKAGVIPGDIILGGLFRVHQNNQTDYCGNVAVEVELGIQRLEAMVYAIHEINKNPDLLPNVTLGAEIRDTCSMGTIALEESLKFILDSLPLRANTWSGAGSCVGNTSKDVVGVVGASRSSLSIEVAKLLRLFKVPQVSYASTSAELSNHERYNYFARTVPPDTLQALAMLHIIKRLKWTSVFTVNSVGSYGEKGIEEFKKHAGASICVVLSKQVTDKDKQNVYDDIIDAFLRVSSTTRVVVLFMQDKHAKELLKAANRNNFKEVVWLASDEWGIRQDFVDNLDLGNFWDTSQAITISLPSTSLRDFETYFRNLNGSQVRDANPWFQKYWQQEGCNDTCAVHKFNGKIPYVIDAVYAFAHALHDLYKEKCGPKLTGLCAAMKPVDGTELRDRLLNVTFHGRSSDRFSFESNGDSKGHYNISFYGRTRRYMPLGRWKDVLNLTGDLSSLKRINSTCDDLDCDRRRRMRREDAPCCFTCSDCPNIDKQYISPLDNLTCFDCEHHQRPTYNRDGCEDLPLRYTPNAWVIVVSVLAGLGVVFTLIVATMFLYKYKTPLVKASGRDLIFPLLVGVLLDYLMTFFFVSEPNVVICGIQRFGFGFSSSICYASILLKTNRIWRIFRNKNMRSVSFIKPHTQLLVLVLLVAIEVSLVSVGLIMNPPKTIKVLPTMEDVLVKCNISKSDYAIALPYNLLLVILCTIYAFRTRKMPSSFNEAKYLGFVMYTTCIIWIAFLPVFYGTAENYQPIALSLNMTLNATTILVFLFGPKMYIMIFSPSRNTQSAIVTTIHSASIVDTSPPITANTDNSGAVSKAGLEDNQTDKPFSDVEKITRAESSGECSTSTPDPSPSKAAYIYKDGDSGIIGSD